MLPSNVALPTTMTLLQQDPPSPSLEDLELLVRNVLVSALDPLRQPLEPLAHRLGDPQCHLVLEDIEDGEDEEGNLGEAAPAEDALPEPRQETPGSPQGVLGVVGRLGRLPVRASAEYPADEGYEGRTGSASYARGQPRCTSLSLTHVPINGSPRVQLTRHRP